MIIDITMELSERTPVYASDPHVQLRNHTTLEEDGYAVSSMAMGSHSGTHVDAPCHMVPGGGSVVDIPLDTLVGKCLVVDVREMRIPRTTKRVLIKGNTGRDCTLNVRQAEALLKMGVELIGTDGLSIGDDEVHKILLEAQCAVLECLDLGRANPGGYFLCAMPLKVDLDGAPVRACLLPLTEE
ncbi:MAG: cyclase family protein [Clostridia bacterium]|nr:cyclase family protein [Clostridia bacterium]